MKKKNGFTLVELIAAITILGVLLLIGSQVVIDTVNKNKVKVVYTSIDNVTKQARLTFLEDPDISKSGNEEFRKAMVYNKEDFEIDRGGESRIICLKLKGKFKNLKFDYFLKDKNKIYCAHDYNANPVWYFNKRRTYGDLARKHTGITYPIEIFLYNERDDDYFFYLYDETLESCPVKKSLVKGEINDSKKIDGEILEKLRKRRVNSICKVFVSKKEYDKYAK